MKRKYVRPLSTAVRVQPAQMLATSNELIIKNDPSDPVIDNPAVIQTKQQSIWDEQW